MSRNLYTDSSQKQELISTDQYLSNTQSAPKNASVGSSGHYSTTTTSNPTASYDSAPSASKTHPISDEFRSTPPQSATAHSSNSPPSQVGYSASDKDSSAADQILNDMNNNPYSTTKDEDKDAAYRTYNKTSDKRANANDETLNTASESNSKTADTTSNVGNATVDKAVSAKKHVQESAKNAYDKAAEVPPSTEQVKATTSGATTRIGNAVSSGIATVSDIANSVFTAASNTAANVVENSEQSVAQGTEVVKQNVAQGTEAVKQNVAQGAEVVKQNHDQIAENSTTTSSESSRGVLPLEKILEMNAESKDTSQPKMVYALAADDGSVKVLGEIPGGVSKEQMDNAMSAQGEFQPTQQGVVPGANETPDLPQHRVPGAF